MNINEIIDNLKTKDCLGRTSYYKNRYHIEILEFVRDVETGKIKASDSIKKDLEDKIMSHVFENGSFESDAEHEIYRTYERSCEAVKIENGELNILGDRTKTLTVAELIEALSKVKDKSEKVYIQFRDEGGEYSGMDDTLYLREENGCVIL